MAHQHSEAAGAEAVRYFGRGAPALWRSRLGGAVGYVIPCTVVADGADVTVLYQATGVTCKARSGRRGGPRGRSLVEWDGSHRDAVWPGPDKLRLHVWGTAYSVIRSWDAGTERAHGWYINPEAPWRRTAIGFDSRDLVLDVTVRDDLSGWAWKDIDELQWQLARGGLSRAEGDQAWQAGRAAIDALERRRWPFVDDWSEWRPDPDWPLPRTDDGWDR